MHHDEIEPSRGKDGVGENQRFGAETYQVAGAGAAAVHGPGNGLDNNLRVGHHIAGILLASLINLHVLDGAVGDVTGIVDENIDASFRGSILSTLRAAPYTL